MEEQMELPAVRDQGQTPAPSSNSTAELMRIAIETGADPAYLEKLMDLQDRHNKGIAEKAYFAAMNAVQAEMQPVVARHSNDACRGSRYAKLKDVAKEIQPLYLKHGFSITFSEGEALREDEFRTIATVMHIAGHKEEPHIDLAVDTEGPKGGAVKTKVQGKGSSITYARRYLLCSIFNLQIVDDDNDGNGSGPKFASLTMEEINQLKGLVKEAGVNVPAFFKAYKATKYEDFPKEQFQKAVKVLNQRIDQKNAA